MLKLNEKTHIYTLNGVKVPGVTSILYKAGLIDLSKIPPDRLESARKFGSVVHKATELHDKGTLDPSTVDPAIEPYLEAWFKFLDDTGFLIESIEEKVYSEKFRYAGKYDRIGRLKDVRTIIDIKTSVDFGNTTSIQLAAYMESWNEGTPVRDKIKRREVVLLKGNGTYELAPKDFFQKSDFRVFLSCLTLFNWKALHKC